MKKNLWIVAMMFLAVAGCKPHDKPVNVEANEAKWAKVRAGNLAWNKTTMLEDYEKHGSHNPAWDSQVKWAIELYSESRAGSTNLPQIEQDLYKALKGLTDAQCDDPLMNYLMLRSEVTVGGKRDDELAPAFRQAADRLTASGYAPIRKFYGVFRAADSSKYINKATPPEFYPYRQQVLVYLDQVVRDRSVPAEEVYQIIHNMVEARFWTKNGIEGLDTLINKTLFEARPVTYLSYLARGEYETQYAWSMRGGGYANTVTDEGWKGFSLHLSLAYEALQKAWAMDHTDARIPTRVLAVNVGRGDDRKTMEQWFKRAMDLNPCNYQACQIKLQYLQPKWYGSPEEMLAFGRECVESSTWKGQVPMILLVAHQDLATYLEKDSRPAYWRNPGVWPDVKAAYEKFFELNPDAYSYRHGYVRDAWLCQEWDDLNKQLPLMVETNVNFFGGAEQFQKILKDAKDHESQPAQ